MSRNKLAELELSLPVLPTTSVGSLPKSRELTEARRKFAQNRIGHAELEKLEVRDTEFWVKKQDELGLDVIVDGEMYRGDMAAYFAETMQGFKTGELVRSYGNRYYRKPVIAGKVKWCGPITAGWWQLAQSFTEKPVKGMITGPYTMMDWSFNEFYPSRHAAALDIAAELRKEVEALVAAGARIIQIDEPAISTRIDEMGFVREAMNIVTGGIDAYFICHICYGDFAPVYEYLNTMNVDNFDLETSMRPQALEEFIKANRFEKDISYGVADVHRHEVESVEKMEGNIRHALTLFDREALWIDPDCGLKTRTTEEAVWILSNMQAATENIRRELACGTDAKKS
jgi:5-methyltetrahydropteroyltriglutamate--homocysteine methyltransferase